MAQMQATAIITAVDRASPVFARVAQAASAAAGKYAAVAGRMDAVSNGIRSAAQGFALPAVAAMGALISRTQEFEKALVGVQVANIADNLKDGVVNFEAIRKAAADTKEDAFKLSKAMSMSPLGFVKAAEAAQKMGMSAEQTRKIMEMSGAVHMQDPQISQEKSAEFLGSIAKQYGADKPGRDFDADVVKYANQWLGVANMTKTSASRLEDGLRQFMPLYAGLGESFLNTSALVGAMTQANLTDTESGTALKSLGNRMLNMTHPGRDAMLVSGLWDEIQKEKLVDMSAQTSRQAMLNMKQLFTGRIKGKDETDLRNYLDKGQAGKLYMDAAYQQNLFAMINRMTGAKDAPTMEANQEKALTALLTGGGKIQMSRIIEIMARMQAEGRLTDAQLGKIGEGRHIARYKALFAMMPEFKKLQEALRDIKSEFTDAGTTLWNTSDAGKWAAAVASMDRALMRLRSSEGIRATIGMFEQFANAVASAPQGLVEFGGKALAASVGIGALGIAFAGLAKAATVIAGSPILRALLLGGGALAAFGGPMFMGADRLDSKDLPIDTMFGPGAPIWTTLDKLKALSDQIGGAFGDMGSGIGRIIGEFGGLFGLDPKSSSLGTGLTFLNSTIDAMTANVAALRSGGSFLFGGIGKLLTPGGLDEMLGLKPQTGATPTTGQGTGFDRSNMLRDLGPQRVDVQGNAEVKVQNEITVKVEGPGTVTNQTGGTGTATVPLNTGKTMPDTGPQ